MVGVLSVVSEAVAVAVGGLDECFWADDFAENTPIYMTLLVGVL